MADKDDFTFDEEESGVDSEQESEDWGDYEPEKKKGSKRLLYMLLLLVVLVGGAAYMFLLAPADGPSPPVNVVKAPRKTIATPMPKAAPASQPAKATVPVATPDQAKTVAAPAPPVPAPTPTPTALPATPVKSTPAAPVVVKVEPPPAPVPVAKPAAPEAAEVKPKLFESKPAPAPMAAGNYTLSAGAFVMQSSVNGVTKKIRKLGYEPEIQELKRKIEMTRLLVGVYSHAIAAKKLATVKKVASGAFSLNKGSKTAVYAGSYLVLDKARVFADTTLSENGIRVTEEPVMIERILQRVTFGSFASRADAAKASQKVAAKGLEAKPAKK
jgi:hypothetical protein